MAFDKSGKYHMNPAHAKQTDKMMGDGDGADGPHEMLKQMHAKHGGKHMHIHHDGVTHTTHHTNEAGEVEGPHEHGTTDDLKNHISQVFDGEDGDEAEENEPEHELSGY